MWKSNFKFLKLLILIKFSHTCASMKNMCLHVLLMVLVLNALAVWLSWRKNKTHTHSNPKHMHLWHTLETASSKFTDLQTFCIRVKLNKLKVAWQAVWNSLSTLAISTLLHSKCKKQMANIGGLRLFTEFQVTHCIYLNFVFVNCYTILYPVLPRGAIVHPGCCFCSLADKTVSELML